MSTCVVSPGSTVVGAPDHDRSRRIGWICSQGKAQAEGWQQCKSHSCYGYQDGPAAEALFDTVEGAVPVGRDLYLSDSDVIRHVNLQSGIVKTLTGKHRDSSTVDGSFAESRFLKAGPMVAVGSTLYVIQRATEHGGACIRSIDLSAQRTATITGDCKRTGNLDGNKDTAMFSSPRAMVSDGQNLYVADSVRVRAVALPSFAVTTLAGEADAQCDFGFHRICKGGWVDGVGNEARFESIRSLALMGRSLYIADGDAIRMLDLNTRKVTTVNRLACRRAALRAAASRRASGARCRHAVESASQFH